jgi:hypothetical protein
MGRNTNARRPIVRNARPTRVEGPAQNGNGSRLVAGSEQPTTPSLAPVDSAALSLRQTDNRNGVTGRVLSVVVDPRSRCQPHAATGRMAEEANALGKAEGYADVGPMVWKVGSSVGVQTS